MMDDQMDYQRGWDDAMAQRKAEGKVLAEVEGWIGKEEFGDDGKLGASSYLWLWRKLPRELERTWGQQAVTVIIKERK